MQNELIAQVKRKHVLGIRLQVEMEWNRVYVDADSEFPWKVRCRATAELRESLRPRSTWETICQSRLTGYLIVLETTAT